MTTRTVDPKKSPGLTIDQIVLVNAEFRHRDDYLSLPASTNLGEFQINIETKMATKSDGTAVALSVSAATSDESAEALYQFRVEVMALIREVPDSANIPALQFVAGAGIATVFPFLREAVANLTMRGRFGPVWLRPVNLRLAVEALENRAEFPAVKPTSTARTRGSGKVKKPGK